MLGGCRQSKNAEAKVIDGKSMSVAEALQIPARAVRVGLRLENIVFLLAALLVFWLIALPLIMLLMMSFRVGTPLNLGPWSIENYQVTYTSLITYQTLLNTLIYAVVSVGLSMLQAIVLAWLIERTDMPLRTLAWALIILPIGLPSMLSAVAWILLLNPTVGIINVALRDCLQFFGMHLERGPFNIYTLWGMIFVNSIVGTSTFMLVVGAFRMMNRELEDAAQTSGASKWKTFRRVTLGVMLPSLSVAAVYKLASDFNDMDIPLLLGLQERVFVVATLVFYSALFRSPPEWALATAVASPLVLLSIGMTYLYFRLIVNQARAQKYATVTGKIIPARRVKLGQWRFAAFGAFVFHFLISTGLPLATLFYASLLPSYRPPSAEVLGILSFNKYIEILTRASFARQLTNSIVLGTLTATMTMVLALLISWIVVRSRARGRFLLDACVFVPYVLPGSVIAIGLMFTYLNPSFRWIPVYGSLWILALGMGVGGLPFATRLLNGALTHVHAELEEAARVSGARRLTALVRITLPIVLPTFVTGWLWGFIHGMRSMTVPLMLSNPKTETLGVLLFHLIDREGDFAGAAALGMLLVLMTGLVAVLSRRVFARSLGAEK
jgi:iron(III) transport system permease protein